MNYTLCYAVQHGEVGRVQCTSGRTLNLGGGEDLLAGLGYFLFALYFIPFANKVICNSNSGILRPDIELTIFQGKGGCVQGTDERSLLPGGHAAGREQEGAGARPGEQVTGSYLYYLCSESDSIQYSLISRDQNKI